MHKSISLYASALKCTPGHLRRHIRAGLIPSAKLVKGKKGRPGWVIEDASPETIRTVAGKLQIKGYRRPTFWEPRVVDQFETKSADGRPSLSREIHWREIFVAPPKDYLSVLFDLADRAALVRHALTRDDLLNPPVHYPDKYHCVTLPAHEIKERAYYRTQRRLLTALFRPPTSLPFRWVKRMADVSIATIDVMQAALQLARYHRLHAIKIDHRNLSMVLGISKSTLYRRYDSLVSAALRLAHKHGRSTTQIDRHQIEREEHPGLRLETDQQGAPAFALDPDFSSQPEGTGASNEELHETSLRTPPLDLSFELLLDAAIQVARSGKPVDFKTLTDYLRGQRSLTRAQHVRDFWSDGEINNAVAGARLAAA